MRCAEGGCKRSGICVSECTRKMMADACFDEFSECYFAKV